MWLRKGISSRKLVATIGKKCHGRQTKEKKEISVFFVDSSYLPWTPETVEELSRSFIECFPLVWTHLLPMKVPVCAMPCWSVARPLHLVWLRLTLKTRNLPKNRSKREAIGFDIVCKTWVKTMISTLKHASLYRTLLTTFRRPKLHFRLFFKRRRFFSCSCCCCSCFLVFVKIIN